MSSQLPEGTPPAGMQSFKVVKTNRFGRQQERVLSLDFASGSIVSECRAPAFLPNAPG